MLGIRIQISHRLRRGFGATILGGAESPVLNACLLVEDGLDPIEPYHRARNLTEQPPEDSHWKCDEPEEVGEGYEGPGGEDALIDPPCANGEDGKYADAG